MTILNNKQYEVAKWLVQIVMPAVASAYFALSQLVGLPAGGTVAGVMAILTTLVGTVLGISTKQYNQSDARFDGYIEAEVDPGGVKTINLVVNGDPETAIEERDELIFKINRSE